MDALLFFSQYILKFSTSLSQAETFLSDCDCVVNFEHLNCYFVVFNKTLISFNVVLGMEGRDIQRGLHDPVSALWKLVA